MPKISVVMPAYNAEKYIAEAINSILGQTYGDFEFIIINDCSQDRTEEIILSYEDPRIVYLKNEKNMGVAATLNRGLAIAQGEYIARMDADDISLPERFEKQMAYLDTDREVAVLGTAITVFDERGTEQNRTFSTEPEEMKVDMLLACGLAHPSVMMRSSAIRALNGYDPEFNGLEDYELWCRVLENHAITTLPDVLLRYRIHSSQVTKNPSTQYKERMRKLKLWQAERLGISAEDAEAFARFAVEGYPDTVDQILALDRFFAQAYDANQRRNNYNARKMHTYFRAVIMRSVNNCYVLDRRILFAKCVFASRYDLLVTSIKQTIKRLVRG